MLALSAINISWSSHFTQGKSIFPSITGQHTPYIDRREQSSACNPTNAGHYRGFNLRENDSLGRVYTSNKTAQGNLVGNKSRLTSLAAP
jgi:hypothetical protein